MHELAISKKPGTDDWHPAFIVYQLRLKGLSLRRLARLSGYAASSGTCAMYAPFPKIERLIADAIGVEPQTIWPSRYDEDGIPKGPRRRLRHLKQQLKRTTARGARNVQVTGSK